MPHLLGGISFPLTQDDDAEGQKWPNADPKEFGGNLLANYMYKTVAQIKRKGANYVEDGSKSNAIFPDFPEIHKYLSEEKPNLTDDSSAVFDESCIEQSASQS